jgi:hypothetical protein
MRGLTPPRVPESPATTGVLPHFRGATPLLRSVLAADLITASDFGFPGVGERQSRGFCGAETASMLARYAGWSERLGWARDDSWDGLLPKLSEAFQVTLIELESNFPANDPWW